MGRHSDTDADDAVAALGDDDDDDERGAGSELENTLVADSGLGMAEYLSQRSAYEVTAAITEYHFTSMLSFVMLSLLW